MLSAEEFLGTTTTSASVKPPLIPVSDTGYLALIDDLDLKDFKYKTGDRAGQTGYRLVVKWQLIDAGVVSELKAKNRAPFTSQSVMLNITSEGALAAENPGLKMIREAIGQNTDGQPWQPMMMKGQSARIYINHRIDNKGEEQEEVERVTSA